MHSKFNPILRGGLMFVLITIFSAYQILAQCPMCKMSLESNLQNGGTQGRGINTGILFLLTTPYLIIGGIGYFWWKNRRKKEDDPIESAELNID